MGWSNGEICSRHVGYGVVAQCDGPGCTAVIDRGLAYACGGQHGEDGESEVGEHQACAGYYCENCRYTHPCQSFYPEPEDPPKNDATAPLPRLHG